MVLKEELWIARLAEEAQIETESSTALWRALCNQIEARLSIGEAVAIAGLGLLHLSKIEEYIGVLPSRDEWLIPPRMKLCLEPISGEQTATSLDDLQKALSQATSIRPKAVQRWTRSIPKVLGELLEQGVEVHLSGLGNIEPKRDRKGRLQGYQLHLAQELEQALNRPFAMFVPVSLHQRQVYEQLDRIPIASIEELQESSRLPLPSKRTATLATVVGTKPASAAEPTPGSPTEGKPKAEEQLEATPETKSAARHSSERSSSRRWGIVLLIVLILGVALGAYYWEQSSRQTGAPAIAKAESVRMVKQTTSQEQESEAESIEDTELVEEEVGQEEVIEEQVQPTRPTPPTPRAQRGLDIAPIASGAIPAHANEAETKVVQSGERLTLYAKRKYGHKVFWVYIYEENKDIIRNPDNIPVGTELRLPPANKYEIDASNTNSLERAFALHQAFKDKIR